MYLNKQSSEYARVLYASDAAHSIRSLYKFLSSYRDRDLFRHCQTFKMKRFAKRTIPECRHANRNFSGQGKFFGIAVLR